MEERRGSQVWSGEEGEGEEAVSITLKEVFRGEKYGPTKNRMRKEAMPPGAPWSGALRFTRVVNGTRVRGMGE